MVERQRLRESASQSYLPTGQEPPDLAGPAAVGRLRHGQDFWIPAFAGMTGIKVQAATDGEAVHEVERLDS